MITGFLNLFRVPEIRKKVLVTLGLLLAYRVGFHVPIPGVNYAVLLRYQQEMQGGFAFGIMNALSGGALGSCMLFTLGVMPYISASIIFSLLVKVVPQLEALSKEGQAGQRIINRYTRYATVPICIIQALFLVYGQLGDAATSNVVDQGLYAEWFYKLGVVLTLTTGTLIVMWIGEQITEYGVGNGTSLIIMAGIVARLPTMLSHVATATAAESLGGNAWIQPIAQLIVLYILITASIVFVTRAQRRIPIQQGRQMRGRRVYGGQRHYLPLKVNQAGVIPIIFATSIIYFPVLLASVVSAQWFRDFVTNILQNPRSVVYMLILAGLIVFFSYFYTAIQFDPARTADNLRKQGGFIPGIRPGPPTADYLNAILVRITLPGSLFLAAIALVPSVVYAYWAVNRQDFPFGGTSVLIAVGVALETMKQIESQLMMRHYEGFLR